MDRFGLIGFPLKGSKSPAAFAAAYGGKWSYELLEGPDFGELWETFIKDYRAVNITAPYKERAFERADVISAEAQAIQASNLAVKTEKGICAHNSDFLGLKMGLEQEGFGREHSVLVIGAGGAGKAAAAAAKALGMKTAVTNRTESKARELGERLGVECLPFEEAQSVDLVIYTLPCLIENVQRFRGRTVLEANYKSPVLEGLPQGRYISGKYWHYWQACAGYELMTGEKPNIQAIRGIYNF